jgi:hypothetical protein
MWLGRLSHTDYVPHTMRPFTPSLRVHDPCRTPIFPALRSLFSLMPISAFDPWLRLLQFEGLWLARNL